MAFVKKTWKDRIVQYANRRLLTKSGGEVEQVTVTRDEGAISEAGDQFNASNMNNLEQRIYDAFQQGGSANIIEVTQAEYDAAKAAGTLVREAMYVITDAPNLNPTADDIEYQSGVTVADKLDTIYAPIKSSEVVSIPNGDLAVGSNWSEGCSYVKRNGLIILHLALQGLTANTRNDVYTLPTGCRPSLQIVGAGMGGQSYTAFAQATITTGGVVQVSSVDTYARIHLMYYVNE